MGKTYFVALGAVLLTSLIIAKAQQVPEPVAFYPLNKQFETADVKRRSQITGISNNVSLTTGPFNTTDGAYEFWGNSKSYIQFPNGDKLLDVHNSISLMCWVRPEDQDGPLFQYAKFKLKWGVHIWIDKNGRFFNRIMDAGYNKKTGIESSRRLEVGKWVHVAATYNHITGLNSIYVNGILNRTRNIGTGLGIAAEGNVRMGAVYVDNNRFLRAAVTHMEIYNVSLNANQIQAVMTKVKNGNPCEYHPCQNGGTCISSKANTYQCQCYSKYAGKNCAQFKECVTYKFLNESDRTITYNKSSPVLCDDKLSGWYRFAGDAGNQMPESCVMKHRCGTENPGWLNTTHPAVAEGAIQAKVCFHGSSGCCEWSNNVTVRNCGEFYVYYFYPTPNCSLRYCSKINPTQAPPPPTTSSIGGIQDVDLNASKSLLKVGSVFEMRCTVIGGPISLKITWLKEGKKIVPSHRRKITSVQRQSRLTIRNVMIQDEGEYYCQASTDKTNILKSLRIWVEPVLAINPLVTTKRVGEQVTFSCTVSSGSSNVTNLSVVEVTKVNSKASHQKVSFPITNLQIPQGSEIHVREFICETEYQQKIVSSKLAKLIIVKLDSPECPKDTLGGVEWSPTAEGGMDIKPCPNGALGTATRTCAEEGIWASATFTGCSSVEFNKLADAMDAISGGFYSHMTAQQVLSELSNITQLTQVPVQSPQVYGGDLAIAVDILVKISIYDRGKVSSLDDFDNFAHVASNLLETTNSKTWKELEETGKDRSKILVKAMDQYGLAVAATLNGSTKPVVAQTQNLLMRIDRVKMDSPGLKIAYKQSSIYLPSQAFSSSQDSSAVTIVFLTLNQVFSLPKESENDEGNATSPDTTVISSTVDPRLPDEFDKPVKIVLRNTMINTSTESDAIPQGKCVFWRPDESAIWNTSGCRLVPSESSLTTTTCECDHLTIFAALMDPYDSTIGEGHQKALEVISIVGCSISLLAVLITVAVTLFFWRVMKSPRSKVLLNLCTAIAISCTLVIFEGLARNTTGCPVVAALLHYVLLALFSWMLCEGVLHYILIVKVFGGGSGTKVRYFCLFAWGGPAVVVAVSLAVTRAKGYGGSGTCWLDVDSGLIWAFIGPALLVILINTVVFILVMYQMLGTKFIQDKKQIEKVKAGIKASVVILPLLGLTWLFGLLGFSSDTIVFKYIFAILNSLQGLMIFIFHCALNKEIRDAIKRKRARRDTGFSTGTLKTRASPSMMRSDLAVNQLVLKNRPNRAQSIDSLSLANSTPDQSPKTSRLTLSSKAKKITPSSSANVTPDQSPKTSVHRLTAHYDDVTSVDVNLVMIVTQPKSSERKQTQRKRSMRSFGKKRQTSTKKKTSNEPLKTLEGSDKGVEDNENGIPNIIERLSAQGNRGSLETSAPDDGMLNQLYGKVGEEYDCHSDEHFAKENNACRSFKPFGTEKETKESEGEILQQQRKDKELTGKEEIEEPNKVTECGLVNPACEENSSDSSPNSETGEETTPKDVQPLSSPGKSKKGKKTKKPELGQINQGEEGDEDFEPTQKTWDKFRRKISGSSSNKGTRHEVLSDETSENEDEHMQNNTSF